MKRNFWLISLSSVFLFQGCGSDNSSPDVSTGNDAIPIASQFSGSWVRGSDSITFCENNYDTDGSGTSGTDESQNSFFSAATDNSGSFIDYSWKAYTDTDNCDFSTTEENITDVMKLEIVNVIVEDNNSVTYKTTIRELSRTIRGTTTIASANNFNANNGACGKKDWIDGTRFQASDFEAGCGALEGEDGYDDFKFSNVSPGDTIYWRLTTSGSDLLVEASQNSNNGFDEVDSYYPRP